MSDSEPVQRAASPSAPGAPGLPLNGWTAANSNAHDAERVKRALLATIRHDLRTPINAILGYSDMLLEDEEARDGSDSDLAPDLHRIRGAGAELLELVNDVLDPARIDATKHLDLEHFGATIRRDLRTPITAIIGYSEMLVEDAETAGRDDIIPDLKKICQAAERFLALIDDVVTFSSTRYDVGATLSTGPEVDGAGAAALVQDAITTIRTWDQGVSASAAERGAVLIVDDNDINRDVLTRHLERHGHTATALPNGRAALDAVKRQAFDLVLLDIMMPEVNGYDVLQQLKADAATRDIPVIMISALSELDAVVHCIEMGAEDYLTKPFNQTLLRARTGACLEKKRLRDQEKEYLRHVAELTAAAAAVEENAFEPERLAEAAQRDDALGQLARVFQRMATEIYSRELRLKQEVQQLRIEIDQVKMAHQVAQVTDTDFFQDLQRKARQLRSDRHSPT